MIFFENFIKSSGFLAVRIHSLEMPLLIDKKASLRKLIDGFKISITHSRVNCLQSENAVHGAFLMAAQRSWE